MPARSRRDALPARPGERALQRLDRRQMTYQRPGDDFTKPHRNCVPDQSAEDVEPDVLPLPEELVVVGESLQGGRFTEADGAVLFRMTEAATPISEALSRDGGSRFVPPHPSVDARISSPGSLSMARGHEPSRPIPPATSRLGRADPFQVERAQAACRMQTIVGIGVAGGQRP